MIVLSLRSISMTILPYPILRSLRCKSYLGNIPLRSDKSSFSEVIESIHKQTGGQPFLVNRFAQILTEEMGIPKTETITIAHFAEAHIQLLDERNTNIEHHFATNIRQKPLALKPYSCKLSLNENRGAIQSTYSDIIDELATHGVTHERAADRKCEIANPIYLYIAIIQAFKPIVNGLERDYFPENTDGFQYLTSDGHIQMERLMDNFRDFIARAGFRILQVPETPSGIHRTAFAFCLFGPVRYQRERGNVYGSPNRSRSDGSAYPSQPAKIHR